LYCRSTNECALRREGDKTMRQIVLAVMAVAAAGVASVTTAAPAAAQPDAWCLQGRDAGIPGDCSYSSYAQCMASASGRNAYCNINPRVAFGRPPPPVPRGRRGHAAYPYDYGYPYGYGYPYDYYR
jgi:Protein of unknown function (DUF3551)